jgi:hypothetical protein
MRRFGRYALFAGWFDQVPGSQALTISPVVLRFGVSADSVHGNGDLDRESHTLDARGRCGRGSRATEVHAVIGVADFDPRCRQLS